MEWLRRSEDGGSSVAIGEESIGREMGSEEEEGGGGEEGGLPCVSPFCNLRLRREGVEDFEWGVEVEETSGSVRTGKVSASADEGVESSSTSMGLCCEREKMESMEG